MSDRFGQIWRAAFEQANEDLAKARSEQQEELERARGDVAKARQAAGEAQARVDELSRTLEDLQSHISERDRLLADSQRQAMQHFVEAEALRAAVAERRQEVEQARQVFARDIDALRRSISLTEERARGNERRALTDVEAARRVAQEAAKAFGTERKRLEGEISRYGKLLAKRDAEIGSLRDRLARVEAALGQASSQLKTERANFSKLLAKIQPAVAKARVPPAARRQRRKRLEDV